jgi:hypothetical protein
MDIVKLKIVNYITDEEKIKLETFVNNKLITYVNLKKYIKDNEGFLNIENLTNYVNYRKKFKFKSNNEEFFIYKYGKDKGIIKFNEFKEKMINKITPYKIDYWNKLGFSEKDSLEKIKNYKKNKATSEKGFIERYGEELGKEKFKKFQKTSKHTLEKYIEKYGEELGNKKWDDYVLIKKEKSVFTKNYWLNKGYNEYDSEFLRKEFHQKNLNTSSITYWMDKGISEDDAIDKVREIYKKKIVKFTRASNESIKFLKNTLKFLNENNINHKIGLNENNEFSIYDKENKRLFYYDLTIPNINFIIEYNGERFHPNPNKLNKEEWSNWKTYSFEKNYIDEKILDADTVHKNDLFKKFIAEKNGFEVFVIWSSDDKNEINNKLIQIIKQKYENCKNK